MREIKFRLFDKINGNMIYPSPKIYINMLGMVVYERDDNGEVDEANPETFDLMQYTGLKDKNGKEIYEGDIVIHQSKPKKLFTIVWNDDGFRLEHKFTRTYEGQSWEEKSYTKIYDNYEVIGNIYEQ